MTGVIRSLSFGALLLSALAACEPLPSRHSCRPVFDQAGQMVIGCTPDGQQIRLQPVPAVPAVQAVPAPTPVQTGPIGGIVATGTYGPVPTVTRVTGDPLPPPPTRLDPLPRPGSQPAPAPRPATAAPATTPAPTPSPAPATGGTGGTDPNGLPATVAPPPSGVTSTFPTR